MQPVLVIKAIIHAYPNSCQLIDDRNSEYPHLY